MKKLTEKIMTQGIKKGQYGGYVFSLSQKGI